jgi:glycosyltransferase involved in cell wall biosynthesis
MKVLAANKYYFVKGGAERYFFELADILEAHGHEVVPFAMEHERNRSTPCSSYFASFEPFDESQGLAARARAAARILYSSEARAKIEKLVDDTRPDVAHLHNIAHQLSPSILYGLKSRGVPVVQTLHDFKLVCPNYSMFVGGHTCERCETWRYYNAVLQRCMRGSVTSSALVAIEAYLHRALGSYARNVDVFVAPSRQLKDRMVAHGVDESKIVHLPYSIALDKYEPSYGGGDYGVYVGRLSAGKGLKTLIRALGMAREVKLRIVGSGPLEQSLKGTVEDRGLSNAEFLGYREGEDLRSVVAGALFVVVPSECYENSPLTVYEAFAQGKPVVGSRIGGIPELVSEGESGLVFEAGNAEDLAEKMSRLWEDREGAIEMGRAARTRVETQYGPAAHYEKIMAIYERAMA